MSAHADADELINYCKKLSVAKIKKTFLVHGDYDQQQLYSEKLKGISIKDVEIPNRGDVYEI
jgi:metallo-beta-lactamase family protein